MLNSILDNIKLERAKFSREVEYLTEGVLQDEVDDAFEAALTNVLGDVEVSSDLVEANETLESMSDEDGAASEEEIQRIMEATEDMTFDEMIGVDNFVERI